MEVNNVETKYFVDNKEVKLIVQQCGTKIYQAEDYYYVTNYDEIVATFKCTDVSVPERFIVK